MTPMDNTKPYTKAPKPEIGRGCTFYYAPEGVAAKPCEGCYKLHETAWLEQYLSLIHISEPTRPY